MMQYSGRLDTSGTVFGAQALQRMKFPWSQNLMINPPEGISTITLANLVQSMRLIVLWVLVRFFDPIYSVNLMILTGWVLTGIAAFCLARHLSANIAGAFAAGLICESLPWMREKVMTHVAYTYMCIPLILILIGLKYLEHGKKKHLFQYGVVLLGTFFFDLYWFAFSVILTLLFLVFFLLNRGSTSTKDFVVEQLDNEKRRRVNICIVIFFLTLILYMAQSRLIIAEGLIWDNEMINQFGGSLWRFVSLPSDHLIFPSKEIWLPSREDIVNYVGLSVLVASLFALFPKNLISSQRDIRMRRLLFVIAVAFALLTLPTQVEMIGIDLNTPVYYLKQIFPRIRVFARAGMVTEVVLCVLTGLFISDVSKRFRTRLVVTVFPILIVLLVLTDLNPLGRRFVNDQYGEYSEMRSALTNESNAVVAVIPLELDRNGFPIFVLNNALTAFPNDRSFEEDMRLNASQGSERFFHFLKERGVTHLLLQKSKEIESEYIYKWGDIPQVRLDIKEPYFEELATTFSTHSDVLFRLSDSIQPVSCGWCDNFRLAWNGVRPMFYSQGYFEGQFYEDKDLSWVLPAETPSFEVISSTPTESYFKVAFTLHAAFGGNARPQVVRIQYGANLMTRSLRAGPGLSVEFMIRTGEQVKLKSFLPCTTPNQIDPNNLDTREICYAISDLSVIQLRP